MMVDPFWLPMEAARFARVHPRTLTNAARAGELRALRVGRRWRFRRAWLISWMSTRPKNGAAKAR
jgi:excisionase family DNA binding protein